jgi:hypothetical protein
MLLLSRKLLDLGLPLMLVDLQLVDLTQMLLQSLGKLPLPLLLVDQQWELKQLELELKWALLLMDLDLMLSLKQLDLRMLALF